VAREDRWRPLCLQIVELQRHRDGRCASAKGYIDWIRIVVVERTAGRDYPKREDRTDESTASQMGSKRALYRRVARIFQSVHSRNHLPRPKGCLGVPDVGTVDQHARAGGHTSEHNLLSTADQLRGAGGDGYEAKNRTLQRRVEADRSRALRAIAREALETLRQALHDDLASVRVRAATVRLDTAAARGGRPLQGSYRCFDFQGNRILDSARPCACRSAPHSIGWRALR
jgi:hypothetical protein